MNPHTFRTSTFFNYLSKRRTIQYIHSPFLFKLMEGVFNDSIENRPAVFEGIEKGRKEFIAAKTIIQFEDFGAGGDKEGGRNKEVLVSAIAKRSLKQAKYARFLYRLIQFTKSETIVELGTSLGITTLYLAAAAEPNGKVFTVEADKNVKKMAEENWNRSVGMNSIVGFSFDLNEKWKLLASSLGKIDFLFIDANHREEAMIRYALEAMPYLHERSVMVFDDIHWSEDTLEAWNILKRRKEVTLSFDIYQMGFLFFDKNLSKEDFTLKY